MSEKEPIKEALKVVGGIIEKKLEKRKNWDKEDYTCCKCGYTYKGKPFYFTFGGHPLCKGCAYDKYGG